MGLLRAASISAALLLISVSSAAQPEKLRIVASFSLLADVIRNVTLDAADVSTLIPLGADPHSFEPSARDLAALAEADLIFVAGAGFEESLLQTITAAASGVAIFEASTCVSMRPYGGLTEAVPHVDPGDRGHFDAANLDLDALCDGYDAYIADLDALKSGMGFPSAASAPTLSLGRLYEADCSGGAEEVDDEHSHQTCDPHVWTSPRNVYYWTLYIRDVLTAVDPANADLYAAYEEEYLYAIDDLLRLELEPLLDAVPPDRRVLLTNHETLGYFAESYGFDVLGFVLPGGSALAESSASDLAALVDLVQQVDLPAIFTENTLSARVAEQVAAETGVRFYTLYTDSLSEQGGDAPTYLDFITYNFTTIAAALSE